MDGAGGSCWAGLDFPAMDAKDVSPVGQRLSSGGFQLLSIALLQQQISVSFVNKYPFLSTDLPPRRRSSAVALHTVRGRQVLHFCAGYAGGTIRRRRRLGVAVAVTGKNSGEQDEQREWRSRVPATESEKIADLTEILMEMADSGGEDFGAAASMR
ncbi:hypothetical protein FF1_038397 [Malus domestica]